MIQRGIFSFMSKQGLSISSMRHVLTLYASTKDMTKPKSKKLEWYAEVSKVAQKDFLAFKKVYNKNKKDLTYTNSQSYGDWWNECNLDGSFAYNNASDDF